MIEIEFSNQQDSHPVDGARLRQAARAVLDEEGIRSASVSLVVVDDPTIHRLNREYLAHDYPTDVLSFTLTHEDGHLEGEVIVSADTATRSAAAYGWKAEDELLLYFVHGLLHLVGWDDHDPANRAAMRQRERRHLARWNLTPRYEEDSDEPAAAAPGAARRQPAEKGASP